MRSIILARGALPQKQVNLARKRVGKGRLRPLHVVWPTETSQTDTNYFQLIFEPFGKPLLEAITCIHASNKQDD
jgi:hypothetical protein